MIQDKLINNSTSVRIGAGLLSLTGLFAENLAAQDFLSILPSENSVNPVLTNSEPQSMTSEQTLSKCDSFNSLSHQDRKKIVILYDSLTEAGKYTFLSVLKDTKIDLKQKLSETDFFQTSLLDNLFELTLLKFHPLLESYRKEILDSVILEVFRPGELNQGEWGVCGTSVVYPLYINYPSEAVRIIKGLLSESGEVKLLQSGKVLKRAPYSLIMDQIPGRSISEHLVFSAFMDFGNGTLETYCDLCDHNFNVEDGKMYHGLSLSSQTQIVKALYNYDDDQCFFTRQTDSFSFYEKNYLPGYLPVVLRWSIADHASLASENIHRTDLEPLETENHFIELKHQVAGFDILPAVGNSYDTYHEVTVLKVENKRVYFHNLHGSQSYENSTELTNPPRRIEDREQSIQSMDYDEFISRLDSFLIPCRDHKTIEPRFNTESK